MTQDQATIKKNAGTGARLKAYLEILRPVNCVFGALTVVIGILNAGGGNSWVMLVAGPAIYFVVAGASNTINDYFDLPIDLINRPRRPMPRGDITKTAAMRYFGVLCAVAVVLATIAGLATPSPVLVPGSVAAFLVVGYLYAWKGKPSGFPGNLMVGVAFSYGIPFGALFVVNWTGIPAVIWFFFSTSAFLLISRELVKGMEDMEGDRRFNIKTIANTRGTKTAAIMSIIFSILAVIAFTAPAFFLVSSVAFITFMIAGNLAVVASIVLLLRGRDVKKHQALASLALKAGAFLGLIAYVLAPL